MRHAGQPRRECRAPADDQPHDARCLCGSLVARLVPGGVEIKCRRCQRIVRIELADADAPRAR